MSIELMETTLRYYHIRDYKLLMLALSDFANQDGYCWPGIETLALYQSKSGRQTQTDIKSLIERGDIIVIPGGEGPRDTNKYLILWDKLPEDLLEVLKNTFGSEPGKVVYEDIIRKRKEAGSLFKYASQDIIKRLQQLERRRNSKFVESVLGAEESVGSMGEVATSPIKEKGCSSYFTHNDAKGEVATSPEPYIIKEPFTSTGNAGFGGAFALKHQPNPGAESLEPEQETATIRIDKFVPAEEDTIQELDYEDGDGGGSPAVSSKIQKEALKAETQFQDRILRAAKQSRFQSPSEKARVATIERKMNEAKIASDNNPDKDPVMYHPEWIDKIIEWAEGMNRVRKLIKLAGILSGIENEVKFDDWVVTRNRSLSKKGAKNIGKPKFGTR